MENEIFYWAGRESSQDKSGWYINHRDSAGNILDVSGPYPTKAEAYEVSEPVK